MQLEERYCIDLVRLSYPDTKGTMTLFEKMSLVIAAGTFVVQAIILWRERSKGGKKGDHVDDP